MLVLDTCIIRSFGLDSATAELLRAIRESSVEKIAVPWIALEELAAQRAITYMEKHATAARALDGLAKHTPWETPQGILPACAPEVVREHWRQRFLNVVDVIPTSESALREAAVREANALPPARPVPVGEKGTRTIKTGSRDAAVWLSTIEYTKQNPTEKVFFISSNTKDFGDGTSYAYPMDQDLYDIEDRFVHLTDLGAAVSRIAEPAQVSDQHVRTTLNDQRTLNIISGHAHAQMPLGPSHHEMSTVRTGDVDSPTTEWLAGWLAAPVVLLDSLRKSMAYTIDRREWHTITARWTLGGRALATRPRQVVVSAWCSWETRILLAPDDEPRIILLRSEPTASVTSDQLRHHVQATGFRPEPPSPGFFVTSEETTNPTIDLQLLMQALRDEEGD